MDAPDRALVDVGFYHCSRQSAADVATRLVAKAWAARHRLLLVADEPALDLVDRALWVEDPASFLPHGRVCGPKPADQPILLAPPVALAALEDASPANGASLLMLVGQGLPSPPSIRRFARVLNLFDDGTEGHARARADWKAIGPASGVSRSYWQQTPRGGWEKRQ